MKCLPLSVTGFELNVRDYGDLSLPIMVAMGIQTKLVCCLSLH